MLFYFLLVFKIVNIFLRKHTSRYFWEIIKYMLISICFTVGCMKFVHDCSLLYFCRMVTCSLNGGAGERHPKNNVSKNSRSNHANHADGVMCRTKEEEKHNGDGPNGIGGAAPMVISNLYRGFWNYKFTASIVSFIFIGIMSKYLSCTQCEIRPPRPSWIGECDAVHQKYLQRVVKSGIWREKHHGYFPHIVSSNF